MVLNLELWKARISKIPGAIQDAAQAQLEKNAGLMVTYLQAAAPSRSDIPPSARGSHEGAKAAEDFEKLRSSIHAQPAANRPLTMVILADAQDEHGNYYGPHVEYGHKTPDGSHVREHPFWWPTYRAFQKQDRRRMLDATRKAIKQTFSQG